MGAITTIASYVPTLAFPSTATRPGHSICIGHEGKHLVGLDQAGGLLQGYLCYRTANTYKNDVTVAINEHPGLTATTFNTLYAVDMDISSIHQAYNFADAAYAAGDPVPLVEIEVGKAYWLKVSGEAILEDSVYNPIGAFIGAIDDATPDAVVGNTWGFKALVGCSTDTLTGWAPFLCLGLMAIDTT